MEMISSYHVFMFVVVVFVSYMAVMTEENS